VAVDEAAIVLTAAHRLLTAFGQWHLTVPAVARGSLEAPVGRVEVQVDGMSHNDGLRIWEHHHTHPFLSEFTPFVQGSSYHPKGVTRHQKCKIAQ
jgi:hypothetical protein